MAGFSYIEDAQISGNTRMTWQLLKDAVWALRSKGGNIFYAPLPKFNNKGLSTATVTPAEVIGWLPEDIANLKWRDDEAKKVRAKILANQKLIMEKLGITGGQF